MGRGNRPKVPTSADFVLVAGEAARLAETVSRERQEREGRVWRAVELVLSMYGWTVRAASSPDVLDLLAGDLLAGPCDGTLDGSYEQAVAWAVRWVEQDPEHRYAFVWTSYLARGGLTTPDPVSDSGER